MKLTKKAFILSTILISSLHANNFKEANITVDKADKIVNNSKGKYINEGDLKNEKIKTLKQNIETEQKNLGNLQNQKNKALGDIATENKKAISDLQNRKEKEIAIINDKYNREMELLNNSFKEKEHNVIANYNQNTTKKSNDINMYKNEIVGLEKIEKVVQEKENTPPVALNELNVVYKYIERNNHLDKVMLNLGLIDSIKLYAHTIKKGYPYAVKKRSLDYAMSVADKTNGIDLDYFQITMKNEKLDDIENMMVDINEFLSKNNNILLEK